MTIVRWMRRYRRPRLRPPSPSRREHASLWRQSAAGTIDDAFHFSYDIAGRLVADQAAWDWSAPKLVERVKTVFAREFMQHEGRATATGPQTPKAFLEAIGKTDYWTAETAVRRLVPGLIQTGTMILTGGQTPGRVLLGVRVVSLDGRPITAAQALVREFARIALVASLDLLPLTPAVRATARLAFTLTPAVRILDSDRRSLGDLLAGTRVIRTA